MVGKIAGNADEHGYPRMNADKVIIVNFLIILSFVPSLFRHYMP